MRNHRPAPRTHGYSHEYRLMAPIVSVRDLRSWGLGNNELRKIRDDGATVQGFMYLPQTGEVILDRPEDSADEWTAHAAALLYRPATVTQTLLDHQPRIPPPSHPTRRGSSTPRSSRRIRRTTSPGSR